MNSRSVPHSSNLPSSRATEACSVAEVNFVAEQVYDPNTGKCEFIVRQRAGQISRETHLDLPSGQRVKPIDDDFIRLGKVRLPSNVVDGGDLTELERTVLEHVRRYVHLSEPHEAAVVAFILYTWQFERFESAPALHLIAQPGSGKSRLLTVLGDLCYRGLPLDAGSSHSSLFRSVDRFRGTLCLDEADFSPRNREDFEIARALRSGFQKGIGFTRTEGGHDNWSPRHFNLFGPKVFAGLRPFSDLALESRCVPIVMRSGVSSDSYPVTLPSDYAGKCTGLRGWLLSWRLNSYFEPFEPRWNAGLDGRIQQVFGPLLSVLVSSKLRLLLEGMADRAQAELREARSESPDGAIFASMLLLASQAKCIPVRLYLQDIVANVPASADASERSGPSAKMVSSFCQQLGMQPTKDRKGRWVDFDPADHGSVLQQFGRTWEPAREEDAA